MAEGTLGCQGCGGALSMRLVLKELGQDAVAVLPACCWSIIDGPWPVHALDIPVLHTAFETAAVVATGVKAAKTVQGKDTTVVAWAGDRRCREPRNATRTSCSSATTTRPT